MNRRELIGLLAGAAASPIATSAAHAQQNDYPSHTVRIAGLQPIPGIHHAIGRAHFGERVLHRAQIPGAVVEDRIAFPGRDDAEGNAQDHGEQVELQQHGRIG